MAFAYPELSLGEIVNSLSELLGIQLEEKLLKKPDSLQWQEIYARIVEEVTGAPEDWYYQQPFQQVEIEYPELYTKSFPLINLSSGLQKIMPPLGVEDFNLGDIIFPTTHRLRKICSAVVNFLRFKHTRLPACEDMKAEIEMDRERHDILIKRNEELKTIVKQLREDRVQQEPQVAQANEEINEKATTLQELQRAKQQKQKEIQDIKTKISETTAKVDQTRCSILKAKDEADQLSQKIVVSPDKVRAEQENMERQVKDIKEAYERKQTRLSDLCKLRENYKQGVIDVEKGIALLEGIQAHINRESEIVSEIAQLQDRMQEQSSQARELDNKKSQLQQMLTMRQEKLSKLSIQHKSKMKVMHEQLELLKQQKESTLQKQSCQSERQQELMAYKMKLEEEMKKEKRIVDERIKVIMDMYCQLIEQADKGHVDLGTYWNEVRSALKQ